MTETFDSLEVAEAPNAQSDLEVFTQVVSAMKNLDPQSRLRLFRTLATFFGMSFSDRPEAVPNRPRSSRPRDDVEAAKFSEDRSLSPKDFLFEKKPTTDIERIVCLAYYLAHYRETPHFKTLDLSKLNTEAAQIKFSNAANAVDNAARAGFLVPASKGQKQLSSIGEVYVQALPDRSAAREAASNARPRKNRSKLRSANSPFRTRGVPEQ